MASDFPFSVTSKLIDTSGAEHLVTIRAATVDDFAKRLADAATLFPYAGFTRPQTQAEVPLTPVGGNGQGRIKPGITEEQAPIQTPETARELTQRAHQRAAQARAVRKNGDGPPNGAAELCPVHQRAAPSKWGGLYCPDWAEPGVRCKWTNKTAVAA
jgi:hypothetical protein